MIAGMRHAAARSYWLARARQLAPIGVFAAVVLLADLHLILFLGPWLVTR